MSSSSDARLPLFLCSSGLSRSPITVSVMSEEACLSSGLEETARSELSLLSLALEVFLAHGHHDLDGFF